MKSVKTLLLVVVLCFLGSIKVEASESMLKTGYIWLGDSRFVGMNRCIHMDEYTNNFVVAKSGEGLRWLKDTATSQIDAIIADNQDIVDWVIITGLGVNDYWNVDSYLDYYSEFDNVQIVLVSVNPVEIQKYIEYGIDYTAITNGIAIFNASLQETDYKYIDVYSVLMDTGFETVDGVHYTEDTYIKIYKTIKDALILKPVWRGYIEEVAMV